MFIFNSSESLPNMTRRELIRSLGALGACGLVENQLLAQVFTRQHHISRLAGAERARGIRPQSRGKFQVTSMEPSTA
jgi:hypothetical protein